MILAGRAGSTRRNFGVRTEPGAPGNRGWHGPRLRPGAPGGLDIPTQVGMEWTPDPCPGRAQSSTPPDVSVGFATISFSLCNSWQYNSVQSYGFMPFESTLPAGGKDQAQVLSPQRNQYPDNNRRHARAARPPCKKLHSDAQRRTPIGVTEHLRYSRIQM